MNWKHLFSKVLDAKKQTNQVGEQERTEVTEKHLCSTTKYIHFSVPVFVFDSLQLLSDIFPFIYLNIHKLLNKKFDI